MKNSILMHIHRWNAADIPEQHKRVVMVTGSSGGIGFEIAKALACKQATVILAVRNTEKGRIVQDLITQILPDAAVIIMDLDLASLDSIKRFAEHFRQRFVQLDLLINNAGIMAPPFRRSVDGFELQFATNHLGHFALTLLLIDILKTTEKSRIVTVSSSAHYFGRLDLDDLNWTTRRYRKWQAYGDSKLANLYFTRELQLRLEQDCSGTIAVSAHPGWSATELQRHQLWASLLNRFFAQTAAMGALPVLYAATAPDVRGGDYFGPDGFAGFKGFPKRVGSSGLSQDMAIARRLWSLSETMTGVRWI
jgi:NAD(P)-dependent dehydrogenase (short-subunit alcohol dehydrogenase family)